MVDWIELVARRFVATNADAIAEVARSIFEAGRARWPDVALAPEDLVEQLATHAPADRDVAEHLRALVATDVVLAAACAKGDERATRIFDAEWLSRVPRYVAKIDRSADFGEEVRQLVRERLLVRRPDGPPRIAEYTGRSALASWVRVTAVRVALNLRERPDEGREHRSDLLDGLAGSSAPDVDALRARHLTSFEEALKRAVQTLPSEQRVLLKLYFESGQNTSALATAFRVDRSTAARRLVAARQAVFDETRRLLAASTPMGASELKSLALALQGDLNLSLASLFKTRVE